jgi:hypothetical protein
MMMYQGIVGDTDHPKVVWEPLRRALKVLGVGDLSDQNVLYVQRSLEGVLQGVCHERRCCFPDSELPLVYYYNHVGICFDQHCP